MSAFVFLRGRLNVPAYWLAPALVMAMTGMAGLWRLPYLAGQHGGGSFLCVYAASLVLMGGPMIAGQLLLARGRCHSLNQLLASWTPRGWAWLSRGVGLAMLAGAAGLLAIYGVITGWVFALAARGVAGDLTGMPTDRLAADFNTWVHEPERGLGWLLLFWIVLVGTSVVAGRRYLLQLLGGLFIAAAVMMAVLFFASNDPGPQHFPPLLQFRPIDASGVLLAITEAFYALGLGGGFILVLGQGVSAHAPVFRQAGIVVGLIALAGLASCLLWPAIFDTATRFALSDLANVLVHIPAAMPTTLCLAVFFVLVLTLALTSALALFEILIQAACALTTLSRSRVAISLAGLLLILGLFVQHDLAVSGDGKAPMINVITAGASQVIFPLAALWIGTLLSVMVSPRALHGGGDTTGRLSLAWRVWRVLARHPMRLLLIVVALQALGVADWVRHFWNTP